MGENKSRSRSEVGGGRGSKSYESNEASGPLHTLGGGYVSDHQMQIVGQ